MLDRTEVDVTNEPLELAPAIDIFSVLEEDENEKSQPGPVMANRGQSGTRWT